MGTEVKGVRDLSHEYERKSTRQNTLVSDVTGRDRETPGSDPHLKIWSRVPGERERWVGQRNFTEIKESGVLSECRVR